MLFVFKKYHIMAKYKN